MEKSPPEPGYTYELRIPKERVAVLIGKDGKEKKHFEEQAKVKLNVDSNEGDVFISGNDALGLFTAREIVKAIGRGFNPEIAQLLLKQDYVLELINLMDYVKSKNQVARMKGRVIGTEGKSRKAIEQLSESFVCIYGKTIGIIGLGDQVAVAKQAINMLLEGSPHATVYKWLESKRRRGTEPLGTDASFIKSEEEMKESAKLHKEKVKQRRALKKGEETD